MNEATPTETAATITRQSDANEQLQLVTFEVGDEEFAIDILAVQEINRMMQITRVPQSPPSVEGVINLRGRIIPVIDLRKRFRLDAKRATASRASSSSRSIAGCLALSLIVSMKFCA